MKARTRGTVNEETFNHVKELQKMGASIARAARFVGLSPATVSRMFNNNTFESYRKYVTSISNNKRKPAILESTSNLESNRVKSGELQDLTNAVIRLAEAIEESSTKKKSLW